MEDNIFTEDQLQMIDAFLASEFQAMLPEEPNESESSDGT